MEVHADLQVACLCLAPAVHLGLVHFVEPAAMARSLKDLGFECIVLHARGVVGLKKGLHHVVGLLGGAMDVHQSPMLLVGVGVVRHAAARRGDAACVLDVGFPCFPPAVGEREDRSTGAWHGVREQRLQKGSGGVCLRTLVGPLFVAQGCRRHVAVGADLGEVHGLVAALGKVHGGGVRHIPAVHVQSPEVDVGQCCDQIFLGQFAMGRRHGVVGIRRLNGGRSLMQGLVPKVQGPSKPFGVEVVFVAEFPNQDGRVRLELLDVVEVGARLQIVEPTLVVSDSDNHGNACLVDLVEHGLRGDGLVHADGVDAHVLHQCEVLRQRFEAALRLANRDWVVAHGLDEEGTVRRVKPPIFGPYLAFLDFLARGSHHAQQENRQEQGKSQDHGVQGAGFKTWRSSSSRWPA